MHVLNSALAKQIIGQPLQIIITDRNAHHGKIDQALNCDIGTQQSQN